MPITGKQFELGIDSEIEGWMKKIHGFLSSHPELAYTLEELAREVDGLSFYPIPLSSPTPTRSFSISLDKLIEIAAVEVRIVKEQRYYRVGPQPLDL